MQARLRLPNRIAAVIAACLMSVVLCLACARIAAAQGVSTTTVTGTVYLANGAPGSGTLQVSWPAFTTAAGQAIAAGRLTTAIGADGFVSLQLAPNLGAAPAGLFYTAIYNLSDGSTSTEYWVVPAAAQATIGAIRAQVMPAAQAVQAVSKAYVDQSISQAVHSQITPSGGTLTGPLYLAEDPSQPSQAATKHYVDQVGGQDLALGGGQMTGPVYLFEDPAQDTEAANKHYVDQSVATALPLSGGTLTGPVALPGDPSADAQAANKHYVDESVRTALPLSGGTLTGPVALSADPTADAQAANKHYVDQSVRTALPLSGGTLSGPVALAGDPTADAQAASKHYVDQSVATALPLSGGTLTGPVALAADPAVDAQAANKHYVDQTVRTALPLSGGTLTGPVVLAADPAADTQAANKHYVDQAVGTALPLSGGTLSGPVTGPRIGGLVEVDQLAGVDFGAKLQACVSQLDAMYGGTCDARNFSGSLTMSADVVLSAANATVYLPCATIATASSIVVPAGTRNVTLHGCATRGTSAASGSQGGTVFLYSGPSALLQVGDSTYAADTNGFHADNLAINTTGASAATAQAIAAWRTQEMTLSSLYLLGNANQTGVTLDGTGNYTGGTFSDIQLTGFQTALNGTGHQAGSTTVTDWLNAATFVRLHIACPTSNGNPVAGTTGVNLQAGDGNTFTGGDVEGCATALHLGAGAQNNTLVGVRNENSTTQVQADAGSAYNNWISGGTMFTGKLVDNGTRNSFLDSYHRSFNGMTGDWYMSQQDATVTNHFRLGTGAGAERGMLSRYQTDYGYRWTEGFSDASAGVQYYQLLDELNNVYRLSIGQQNHGQSSSNNQTVLNAAGTGAIVLNGSAGSGTGGVQFGSGGTAPVATVASIDKSGNAQFNGTMQIGGTAQAAGNITLKNSADAEVDYYLWPGLTSTQKGAFTYKDWNGASQWYLVKDQYNNWALNSAVGGLDSFKAYQSTNSGDTYINASNATGHIRLNYENGAGTETDIYSGGSGNLAAAFLGPTAIKFPGLQSASGRNCLQIDNSGYLSNTGQGCGVATNVPAAGLTFPDSSVQTTSQQGALTGAANDSTARTAAANAQSTANGAQSAVTAETTRAKAAEGAAQSSADAAQGAASAEATRAKAAEGTIQSSVTAESTRAQAAEGAAQSSADAAQGAASAEATRAQAAEGTIQSSVTAESTRAQAAEAKVRSASDAEAARAQAAEGTIQGSVTAESTRAQAAEAKAQSAADGAQSAATAEATRAQAAEAKAQSAADGAQSAATAEATRAQAAEGTIQTGVTAETTRAQAAEGTIQSSVTAETTRAQAAEATAQSTATAEVARAQAAEGTIQTGVTAETTRAQAAEATAQSAANAAQTAETTEATRAQAAEGTIQTAVTAESTRAQAAEGNAQTAADAAQSTATAEVARAQAAEGTIQGSVTAETTRAQAAEATAQSAANAAQTAASAEVTRAQTAEATIQSSVTAETTRAQAAEATAQSAADAAQGAASAEATRAQAAEGTIQSSVSAETTRAQAAEATAQTAAASAQSSAGAAQSAVSTETTRAQTAEGSLQSALAAETQRAEQAEAFVESNTVIDQTARDEAGAAQTTANAALPANGATSAGSGSANVVSFPGAMSASMTNGVANVALQAGADVCAQTQNAVNGATAGMTVQSTASGTQPSCASGLTVGRNTAPWGQPITLWYSSPSTIKWNDKVLDYADNFTVRGAGGSSTQPGTKWTWTSGYSGPGVVIGGGNGTHNPQGTRMEDLVLAPSTSTVSPILDLVSNFYPYLHNVHADCPYSQQNLGQIGVRFDDSTAGTMGYAIQEMYESVNCDIGLDLEGPGGVANNLNTFRTGDIVPNYVGVAAGVEAAGSGTANFVFEDLDVAPNTFSVPATAVTRAGGTVTVTTAARSTEIFSVDNAHYVSITGVTGMTWPVNTISTVSSASCGSNGLITVNLNYQLPITPLVTNVSVTGITGYTVSSTDQSPNGPELPVSVNASHTQLTYYSPCNTGDTYNVSAAKVAVAPFLITGVPNNTTVTFSQTGSPDESGAVNGSSYAGTVGICFLFSRAARMSIMGGLCESANNYQDPTTHLWSEAPGAMTVGVWATARANGIQCHNLSVIGTDFPVLDQTSTRDTSCSANAGAWSQNISRASTLMVGKTNQSVIDTPEVAGASSYLRIRGVGSDPTVGTEIDDQNRVAQLQVGTNGVKALTNLTGPVAWMTKLNWGSNSTPPELGADSTTTWLKAAPGSNTWKGQLKNSDGTLELGWGTPGVEIPVALKLNSITTAPCLSTDSGGNVQAGCSVANRVGSLASPVTVTGTTSATTVATIALPALGVNSAVKVFVDMTGAAGNTGTVSVGTSLGASSVNGFNGLSVVNKDWELQWSFDNMGSASSQRHTNWNNVTGLGASLGSVVTTSVDTSTQQNIAIKVTPSNSNDTYTVNVVRVEVLP